MDPISIESIAPGNEVFSSDEENLGVVAGIHEDAIRVEKGFLFVKDYLVPLSAIDRVDAETGAVHLNVTKAEAAATDWEITDEEREDEEPFDSPIDGEGYTVLTGAAETPSLPIIEESDDLPPAERA